MRHTRRRRWAAFLVGALLVSSSTWAGEGSTATEAPAAEGAEEELLPGVPLLVPKEHRVWASATAAAGGAVAATVVGAAAFGGVQAGVLLLTAVGQTPATTMWLLLSVAVMPVVAAICWPVLWAGVAAGLVGGFGAALGGSMGAFVGSQVGGTVLGVIGVVVGAVAFVALAPEVAWSGWWIWVAGVGGVIGGVAGGTVGNFAGGVIGGAFGAGFAVDMLQSDDDVE